MEQSFLTKLTELFEPSVLYYPKLRRFLQSKGFEFNEGKYVFQKELEPISNIHQSYGLEVESIDGKFRVTFYSDDHMRSDAKPIEAETEDAAIVIVDNLLKKFFDPNVNGSKGLLVK